MQVMGLEVLKLKGKDYGRRTSPKGEGWTAGALAAEEKQSWV